MMGPPPGTAAVIASNGRQRPANGRRVAPMKLVSVVVVLAGLTALGCRHRTAPPIAVDGRGADLVFHFGPCGPPPQRIMDLTVTEAGAQEPVCNLVLTHDPRMSIAAQWRYGEVPAAYKNKRCDPLVPGHSYRMEVTRATLDFRLDGGGAVTALASACR
jgi:hypothetical protein